MNKLVVLSGVPGSGKSYFSKTLQKVKHSHVYVISSDELRNLINGDQGILDNDELVWKMFVSLAKAYALDKEGIVILDATHYNSTQRVKRNKELKEMFDEAYLVMWDSPRSVVNNQNLQREHPIAPEVLDKFYEVFEKPDDLDKSFFDKIIIVKDNDISKAIEAINLGIQIRLVE